MNYLTSCPLCGRQLQPHVGGPQSAPWLCVACHRAWWCAELVARETFRPRHKDFGHQPVPGVAVERAEALSRGHSVPDHMLALPGVAESLRRYRGAR